MENNLQNARDLRRRLRDVDLDLSIYERVPNKYIRINPRNPINIKELERKLREGFEVESSFTETGIPGVYRSSTTNIGGVIEGRENTFFLRHYFIQDLASVLAVYTLGLEKGDQFLDMCSAPGFKTVLAHDFVKGDIDITALEIDKKRFEQLQKILSSCEIQAETRLMDARRYSSGTRFDKVLVDAPCSCEGMIVKYDRHKGRDVSGFPKIVRTSQEEIEELAKMQGQLLQRGFDNLKPGGTLVYATCALNRIENEGVIEKFLDANPSADVKPQGFEEFDIDAKMTPLGTRIIPGVTRGLYISRIMKE